MVQAQPRYLVQTGHEWAACIDRLCLLPRSHTRRILALKWVSIVRYRIEEKFVILNSLAHAEADIFAIFERVMAIQKDMYKEGLDEKVKGNVNPNSKNNSPILQRIIQIQDHKLKSLDLELFRILKLQDVKTKTFLLRWIRCIHTR